MSNDREERTIMDLDWTNPEYLANLAAEELSIALATRGIGWNSCYADEDQDDTYCVSLSLSGIRAAETLLALAVPGHSGPGSLYDRATGSCLTITQMAGDAGTSDRVQADNVRNAINAGWVWMIHPDMQGHTPGWHVSVTIPVADANTVTARLNALPFMDDES